MVESIESKPPCRHIVSQCNPQNVRSEIWLGFCLRNASQGFGFCLGGLGIRSICCPSPHRLGTLTNHVTTLATKQTEFIVKALLVFLWAVPSLSVTSIFWFSLDLDLSLSLSVELVLVLEGDGVRFLFQSEFGFGLLVFSSFWLVFGSVDVSWESSDWHSQWHLSIFCTRSQRSSRFQGLSKWINLSLILFGRVRYAFLWRA